MYLYTKIYDANKHQATKIIVEKENLRGSNNQSSSEVTIKVVLLLPIDLQQISQLIKVI